MVRRKEMVATLDSLFTKAVLDKEDFILKYPTSAILTNKAYANRESTEMVYMTTHLSQIEFKKKYGMVFDDLSPYLCEVAFCPRGEGPNGCPQYVEGYYVENDSEIHASRVLWYLYRK